MNPLFTVFGIQKAFLEFDSNVKKSGWIKGNKKLFNDLSISFKTNLEKLPEGGVLVFANHPTGLDPFILASILEREDSICVCDIYQTKKGPSIAKHIIPIYYSSLTDFIWKPPTSWPGFFIMRFTAGRDQVKVAKQKNSRSLQKVLEELQKGRMIIMFPSGGEMGFRPWKAGIGKVIKMARAENIAFTLFGIKISGLSETGLIWHFLTKRSYYAKSKITIHGKKINLKEDLTKLSSYDIANLLKQKI